MTDQETLCRELGAVLPSDRILRGEPMARHCTFRTGGPADWFLRVSTGRELTEVLRILRKAGEPYFLLGRGSNILVDDAGYCGAIVTMIPENGEKTEFTQAVYDPDLPDCITAGSGMTLASLASFAADHSLTGLEFASGIPGTVGGALVMNAGAYGGEMKQVVRSADLLLPDGTVRTFSGEEMQFGYRRSILKENGGTALRAVFGLKKGDPAQIRAQMTDYTERRRSKQPLEYGSAGSTFKRPEGHFAGQLIEEAGLRGFRIGNAGVSLKHCGFVINYGGATTAEVKAVIAEVQRRVKETSGVDLEREVIYL